MIARGEDELADRPRDRRPVVHSAGKPPWYIDFLNLNLDNHDLDGARARIDDYLRGFARDGTRTTANVEFDSVP